VRLSAFLKCFFGAVLMHAVASPAVAEDHLQYADYAPTTARILHGTVQLGTFTYVHAGQNVQPNELHFWGMRDLYLSRNVDVFVRDSLFKELRFAGVKFADGAPVLSAEILDFSQLNCCSARLTVHYTVKSPEGTVLYDAVKSSEGLINGGDTSPFDLVIAYNFDWLMSDPGFLKAIDPNYVPPPSPPAAPQNDLTIATGARPSSDSPQSVAANSPPPPFIGRLAAPPTTAMIAGGAVSIDAFDYPPIKTFKMAPDQIRNTAIGNIHLQTPVGQFLAEAVQKQFRLAGVDVESKDRILSGTIVDFFCDDLGDSIDWTLDVRYEVKDAAGNVLYRTEKVIKETTVKAEWTLGRILRRNAENLLTDADFLKAIGSPPEPANTMPKYLPFDTSPPVQSTDVPPRSALAAHGSIGIGDFTYDLADATTKPYQVPDSTSYEVLFDRPVAETMHDIALNELRVSGIDVRNQDRVLTGEIQKFYVDEHRGLMAVFAMWDIEIRFEVKNRAGQTLYDKVKTATVRSELRDVDFAAMKAVVEVLISDPDFIKTIN
jgi:uncharacterized lipoprotein